MFPPPLYDASFKLQFACKKNSTWYLLITALKDTIQHRKRRKESKDEIQWHHHNITKRSTFYADVLCTVVVYLTPNFANTTETSLYWSKMKLEFPFSDNQDRPLIELHYIYILLQLPVKVLSLTRQRFEQNPK